MKKIVDYVHSILADYCKNAQIAIDFTMGKGSDTLFLAKQIPQGHVYAFDTQIEAILYTSDRCTKEGVDNVTLVAMGHQHLDRLPLTSYDVGIFNFGYYPDGDTQYTTKLSSSIVAVKKALALLHPKGALCLVCYPGHEEGQKESAYFDEMLSKVAKEEYKVLLVKLHNLKEAPYAYIIEKR